MHTKPRKKEMDIDEMAIKHLTTHPNDKSGRYKAQMYRRFGRAKSEEAISNAETTLRLLDGRQP